MQAQRVVVGSTPSSPATASDGDRAAGAAGRPPWRCPPCAAAGPAAPPHGSPAARTRTARTWSGAGRARAARSSAGAATIPGTRSARCARLTRHHAPQRAGTAAHRPREDRGSWRVPGRWWSPDHGRAAPTMASSSGRILSRRLASMARIEPPGRSVRPIEPAKSTSPDRHSSSASNLVPAPDRRNSTEPGVCPGAWSTVMVDAGHGDGAGVGQLGHVVRLGVGQPAAEQLGQLDGQPLGRIREQPSVVGMDVRGDASRAAHRRHREHVVEMPMREQHGAGSQPVPRQHLVQRRHHPDARVDHQAQLARPRRDHVAVGAERGRLNAGHQHARGSSRDGRPPPPIPRRRHRPGRGSMRSAQCDQPIRRPAATPPHRGRHPAATMAATRRTMGRHPAADPVTVGQPRSSEGAVIPVHSGGSVACRTRPSRPPVSAAGHVR